MLIKCIGVGVILFVYVLVGSLMKVANDNYYEE